MSGYVYGMAGWLVLIGSFGIVRSRNLIHAVVCLSVAQAGTYLLLLAVGYQRGAAPPIFVDAPATPAQQAAVVDPVVQAMTLTDIVIQATVTALLLALAIQVHKRHHTLDPDQLSALRG